MQQATRHLLRAAGRSGAARQPLSSSTCSANIQSQKFVQSVRPFTVAASGTPHVSSLPPPKKIPDENGELKAMAWRAKQRGWLELDWLIGHYADAHLANLNEKQLKLFEEILELENPDLYNWLSGIEPVPDNLKDNEVFFFIMTYTNEDHPNLMKARKSN